MKEQASVLSRVGLFDELKNDQAALAALLKFMQSIQKSAGEYLLKEGETGSDFFILVLGQVSVFKKNTEGDMFKVAILGEQMSPGLGEAGLIDEEPRSATIICDNDCQFLVLPRYEFAKFCDQHPAWAIPILKKIAIQLIDRLRQSNRDILLLHKALMNEIRG